MTPAYLITSIIVFSTLLATISLAKWLIENVVTAEHRRPLKEAVRSWWTRTGGTEERADTPTSHFSLVEALIVLAIISIIAAVAIPNLLRNRIAANQASAVGTLRMLNTALAEYGIQHGQFPASLDALGRSQVDPAVAEAAKVGYVIEYHPTTAGSPPPAVPGITGGYVLILRPRDPSNTRLPIFYTDQAGVIAPKYPGAMQQ